MISGRSAKSCLYLSLLLSTGILVAVCAASADVTDFGGEADRFKGNGDLEPPRCQLDVPRAATAPFFVKWNCADNYAPADEIRTELWIYKKGQEAPSLLANFLGFPASVQIDQGILGLTPEQDFTEGLPVSFRLVARDRAGVGTITVPVAVSSQDNSVTTCDLGILTEETESTGSTTGKPAMRVTVSNAVVATTQTTTSKFRVSTPTAVSADPCEIDPLCSDGERVTFVLSVVLDDENTVQTGGSSTGEDTDEDTDLDEDQTDTGSGSQNNATGALVVNPSTFSVDLTGSASIKDAVLTELNMNGEATVDGAPASVTVTCSK